MVGPSPERRDPQLVPSASPTCRNRERGQALIFALLVLLLASIAAAIVGLSVSLDQRAQVDDLERVHSRLLLDAALADALARRRQNSGFAGREETVTAGRFRSSIVTISATRFRVTVEASYRQRIRRAQASVRVLRSGDFRVESWERLLPTPPE